jgi:hypothetical protein
MNILYVLAFIAFGIISLRKGANKKRAEETAKTTLPGRKSGQVIPAPEWNRVEPATMTVQKSPRQRIESPAAVSIQSPSIVLPDNDEGFHEPVIDIENPEDIKKAVIYTEIFNRKDY